MSILGLSITDTKPVILGAGFWIRAAARLIDTFLGTLLGAFAGFAGGIVLAILQGLSIIDPGWNSGFAQGRWLLWLMSLVCSVSYHTFSEGVGSTSLGKLICGLRVMSEDSSPCGIKQALIRSLAYFVDSFVFGIVGYYEMTKTAMEQRHGDHWAKTIVVQSQQVPEPSRRSGLQIFLGLALGCGASAFLMVLTVIGLGLTA